MSVLVLCIAISSVHLSHQETPDCNATFKKHIRNVTFQRIRIDALSATARLSLRYNISFKAEKCCPVIHFPTEHSIGANNHIDNKMKCYLQNFQNVALVSLYIIFLKEWNPYSGCVRRGSYFVCSGIRDYYVGTEEQWYIEIGYECRIKQMIDMMIDIEFMCGIQQKCETVESNYCTEVFNYSQTSFPNTLGQSSQEKALNLLDSARLVFDIHTPCYRYTAEFMCYSLFPPCVDGKPIIPCRQTCIEAREACQHYLQFYKQPLYCGKYPISSDPDVCFYEPVICPREEGPDFGTIIQRDTQPLNTTEIVCNHGYEIVGDRIRHCMYTGFLNGSKPRCILKTNSSHNVALIVGIIVACILSFLVVITVIICRHNTMLCIAHNRLVTKRVYPVAQGKYSLFITYSSNDREKIQSEMVPAMKFELPTWNILTYQENFIGGDNLLEAVHKGIWESTAVIAIITPNYMRSEWCIHEFQEAQTRLASSRQFKFIIVLLEENDVENNQESIINQLPESMRTWIMGRVYLTVGERYFWSKLRRALAR